MRHSTPFLRGVWQIALDLGRRHHKVQGLARNSQALTELRLGASDVVK